VGSRNKIYRKSNKDRLNRDGGRGNGIAMLSGYQEGDNALSLIENIKEMLPRDGGVDILHRSKITVINVGQILVTKGVTDLANQDKDFATYVP